MELTVNDFCDTSGISLQMARTLIMKFCQECGKTHKTSKSGYSSRTSVLFKITQRELKKMIDYAKLLSENSTRKTRWEETYNKLLQMKGNYKNAR